MECCSFGVWTLPSFMQICINGIKQSDCGNRLTVSPSTVVPNLFSVMDPFRD